MKSHARSQRKEIAARDDYEHTLEEVAKEMGISITRVRQIENQAIRKIKRIMEEMNFKSEYLE